MNSQGKEDGNRSDASGHSTTASTQTSSKIQPVPFLTLFRFAAPKDIAFFGVGILFCIAAAATMPAINIIFGDVIDAIAEPINVQTVSV